MSDWAPKFQFTKRFWVGCALLALSVSFLVVTALTALDARVLSNTAVSVPATVVDTREIGSRLGTSGDPKFELTYQFNVSDQTLNMTRSVPEAFFSTHPIGTTWDIAVNANDPSLHDLYENETRNRALGFLAVSLLMAGIGAVFALSGGNLAALRSR